MAAQAAFVMRWGQSTVTQATSCGARVTLLPQTSKVSVSSAALRRANASVYRIRIIHGYTHSTILRDMVQYKYRNHPKVKRIAPGSNPGQTDLILRELF